MIFSPPWINSQNDKINKNLLFWLLLIPILLFGHIFFQNEMANRNQNKKNEINQLIDGGRANNKDQTGLINQLQNLKTTFKAEKKIFTNNDAQLIVEALTDLLIKNGAKNLRIDLLNQLSQKDTIELELRFFAPFDIQNKIIEKIYTSDYLFSFKKINFEIVNSAGSQQPRVSWHILAYSVQNQEVDQDFIISPKNKADIFNDLKVSKTPPVKKIVLTKPTPKPQPIIEKKPITCPVPKIDGILYQQDLANNKQNHSLVFIQGDIYKVGQMVDCYTIQAILQQKILLKDPSENITELYANPDL